MVLEQPDIHMPKKKKQKEPWSIYHKNQLKMDDRFNLNGKCYNYTTFKSKRGRKSLWVWIKERVLRSNGGTNHGRKKVIAAFKVKNLCSRKNTTKRMKDKK